MLDTACAAHKDPCVTLAGEDRQSRLRAAAVDWVGRVTADGAEPVTRDSSSMTSCSRENDSAATQARATLCYMDTVTHREMRNNSGEILRRVEAGESVQVTNNGRVAALIVPPASDPLTDLAQRGQLRPALREPSTLRNVRRRATQRTSAQILADSRGQW